MASILRPTAPLLRQNCSFLAGPARNAAFHSTKSPFAPASMIKPTQLKKRDDIVLQRAEFHATSRRDILPPKPREWFSH